MENNRYEEKILQTLENATEHLPMDVQKIRVGANIGHWNTVLKHCLELMIAGRIRGQKTTKSWVFWIEKCSPNAFQEDSP